MSLDQFIAFCALGLAGCCLAVAVLKWKIAMAEIHDEFE